MTDGILLFHGIARTRYSLWGMARFLRAQGFIVHSLGYPSMTRSLEQIVDAIHPEVERFIDSVPGKIHFVGFSMGGLVIRHYLMRHRPEKLGRVVMLGTPNHGSEVADYLEKWPVFRWLYGPAGQQLVTHRKLTHDVIDYELGIIAGSGSIDPIGSRIIGVPNDGKVSIESTKLAGMKEHAVMPHSHTFLPTRKPVWQMVANFIKDGKFAV